MSKWIIVADRASAKFFEIRSGGTSRRVHFLTQISYPRGRMKAYDINSDRPGRLFGSADTRSSLDPTQTTHAHESSVFAKSLCDTLCQLQGQQLFDSFVLIAPPKFLGVMRKHFKKSLLQKMSQSIPLEISEFTLEDIKRKITQLNLAMEDNKVISIENPTNRHRNLSSKLSHNSQRRFQSLRKKKSA